MKGNAIAGYGIYATQNLPAKALVFKGEEMAQRHGNPQTTLNVTGMLRN